MFTNIAQACNESIPGQGRQPPKQKIEIPFADERKANQKSHIDRYIATKSMPSMAERPPGRVTRESVLEHTTVLFDAGLTRQIPPDFTTKRIFGYRERLGKM